MTPDVSVPRRVVLDVMLRLEEIRQCAVIAQPIGGHSLILDEVCALVASLHQTMRDIVDLTPEQARSYYQAMPRSPRVKVLEAALESLFTIVANIGMRIQNDHGEWKLRDKRQPVSDIIHDAYAVLYGVGMREIPPMHGPNWRPEQAAGGGGAPP